MACFVPANPSKVDASANPFSGMSMGAVSTIYTARTMAGVRGASGADETSHLNTHTGKMAECVIYSTFDFKRPLFILAGLYFNFHLEN